MDHNRINAINTSYSVTGNRVMDSTTKEIVKHESTRVEAILASTIFWTAFEEMKRLGREKEKAYAEAFENGTSTGDIKEVPSVDVIIDDFIREFAVDGQKTQDKVNQMMWGILGSDGHIEDATGNLDFLTGPNKKLALLSLRYNARKQGFDIDKFKVTTVKQEDGKTKVVVDFAKVPVMETLPDIITMDVDFDVQANEGPNLSDVTQTTAEPQPQVQSEPQAKPEPQVQPQPQTSNENDRRTNYVKFGGTKPEPRKHRSILDLLFGKKNPNATEDKVSQPSKSIEDQITEEDILREYAEAVQMGGKDSEGALYWKNVYAQFTGKTLNDNDSKTQTTETIHTTASSEPQTPKNDFSNAETENAQDAPSISIDFLIDALSAAAEENDVQDMNNLVSLIKEKFPYSSMDQPIAKLEYAITFGSTEDIKNMLELVRSSTPERIASQNGSSNPLESQDQIEKAIETNNRLYNEARKTAQRIYEFFKTFGKKPSESKPQADNPQEHIAFLKGAIEEARQANDIPRLEYYIAELKKLGVDTPIEEKPTINVTVGSAPVNGSSATATETVVEPQQTEILETATTAKPAIAGPDYVDRQLAIAISSGVEAEIEHWTKMKRLSDENIKKQIAEAQKQYDMASASNDEIMMAKWQGVIEYLKTGNTEFLTQDSGKHM